jgi:hypothetical protein
VYTFAGVFFEGVFDSQELTVTLTLHLFVAAFICFEKLMMWLVSWWL